MPAIELETDIQADIHFCFDLARSIDLHKISVKDTHERAIAGRTSGLIEQGESVTWEGVHFGIRQRLTSVITALDRPYHFRDEMVKGAFKSIVHDHYFEIKPGVAIMKDVFRYESPLGVLGRIANRIVLHRYLTELLIRRNKIIKEYAESGKWKEIIR